MRRRSPVGAHLAAAAICAFTGAAAAADGDAPVPWPGGNPPDDVTFTALVEDAMTIGRRELADEAVAAIEPPEEHEHMTVYQDAVDQGLFTNADLFRRGDAFFSHEFTSVEGYGDGPNRRLRRVHNGVRGGLDSHSCAGCHTVGGLDGAGSETQRAFLEGDGDRMSSAVVRNAPQVIGAGVLQALAAEMTLELQRLRDGAIATARSTNAPSRVALVIRGIDYGAITATPDGNVDAREVKGLSPDLVVRPFGWKGTVARARRFSEDAARVHFGIQSTVFASGYQAHPDPLHLGPGPNWFDPDNDGVARELEEGTLTASGVYMTMLESPVIMPPFDAGLRARWARGSVKFDEIGCAGCHTREIPLYATDWHERSDSTQGAGPLVKVFLDGEFPKTGPSVKLFSDLQRHDMGAALADTHDTSDGVPRSVFLTRPLWGLADTAPYMHDGRAATIPEAILAHGGEAQKSRDAFAALASDAQVDLHIYLLSLSRAQKPRLVVK